MAAHSAAISRRQAGAESAPVIAPTLVFALAAPALGQRFHGRCPHNQCIDVSALLAPLTHPNQPFEPL